ncbi:MAG: polysaccharide biosynthesis C-terminal domain-containing protein [Bacteroidales bacterium]|jgi:O-antigen/teichoic acid export membrane protein|nr:polysaccharide biosynthesis C-terminal domain-containing protein [Bacteroidales bacterium]
MKRTFIINLILLVFLNLLVKPFWIFGIDRTVQNTVGAHDYGMYAALFSLSIILNIFLDMGITNFNNRNIAQHNHLLQKYFSNMVVLKLLLAVLYAAIGAVIGLFLHFDAQRWVLFAFLLFNQFLLSLVLYLRSNISGLQYFKTDSLISVVDRLLLIALCGFLLLAHRNSFTIECFVYAQTIAYMLTAIIAFVFVYRKAQFFRLRFNAAFLKLIVKQSYPFALLVLLMGLYTRMDMVMLETMLPTGAEQAGVYAQSFRILDAVTAFAYLFSTLLLPMFARMLKHREPVGQLTHLSFLLLIVPTLVFVITTITYKTELMTLMYHDHVRESAQIYGILILSFVPISSAYIFGTLLTANNNLKTLNIIAGGGMLLNFALNYAVIPRYGALGAALASVLTQYITCALQMFMCKRIFTFSFPFKSLALLLLCCIITVLLCYYGKKMLNLHWIYTMIYTMIAGFCSAFALRLISVKDLVNTIKKQELQ